MKIGEKYFTIGLFKKDLVENVTFYDDVVDKYLQKEGLVFNSKEEVQEYLLISEDTGALEW
jgi:hypothetical protein